VMLSSPLTARGMQLTITAASRKAYLWCILHFETYPATLKADFV